MIVDIDLCGHISTEKHNSETICLDISTGNWILQFSWIYGKMMAAKKFYFLKQKKLF